jgi:predicted metal-dependent phosphoesterase TrpH
VGEPIDLYGTCDRIAGVARELGGASVLAHPFRWNDRMAMDDEELAELFRPFDAIEALTTNHTGQEQRRALELGETFGITVTAGSDAHIRELVGRFATEFHGTIRDEAELAAAIRAGDLAPIR